MWFAQRRPRAAGEHVNPRDHERRPAETAKAEDCLEQARASAFSPNDPWRLRDDGRRWPPPTTAPPSVKRVVEEWREANYNFYLPPRVTDDLAERIERAMLRARWLIMFAWIPWARDL